MSAPPSRCCPSPPEGLPGRTGSARPGSRARPSRTPDLRRRPPARLRRRTRRRPASGRSDGLLCRTGMGGSVILRVQADDRRRGQSETQTSATSLTPSDTDRSPRRSPRRSPCRIVEDVSPVRDDDSTASVRKRLRASPKVRTGGAEARVGEPDRWTPGSQSAPNPNEAFRGSLELPMGRRRSASVWGRVEVSLQAIRPARILIGGPGKQRIRS